MKDFVKNLIKDIAVDLNDEFDRNFERKAFFDQPWEQSKLHNPKGSLMMRTGQLRNSLSCKVASFVKCRNLSYGLSKFDLFVKLKL